MSAGGREGKGSTTIERDDWGPLRPPVEDQLLACEDYLGRLRRSFDGEIAPDRHYFEEKAHLLRDAAQALVERVVDVEWWLGSCTEEIVLTDPDGSTTIVGCGRAVGHRVPHQDEDLCPDRRILVEVRSVVRALCHATDRLAWGLLTVRAGAGVTDAETLASELRPLPGRLSNAVSALAALATPSDGADQ